MEKEHNMAKITIGKQNTSIEVLECAWKCDREEIERLKVMHNNYKTELEDLKNLYGPGTVMHPECSLELLLENSFHPFVIINDPSEDTHQTNTNSSGGTRSECGEKTNLPTDDDRYMVTYKVEHALKKSPEQQQEMSSATAKQKKDYTLESQHKYKEYFITTQKSDPCTENEIAEVSFLLHQAAEWVEGGDYPLLWCCRTVPLLFSLRCSYNLSHAFSGLKVKAGSLRGHPSKQQPCPTLLDSIIL
ncbi:hypothetical protein J6590_069617 [Homalodisca vitripennis]|nr:hypothetical protein J6590_069617 [Homalodisca vitripennis]